VSQVSSVRFWGCFLNVMNIFQKSENFPKIWKFSENLKIFRKSEIFPKIWKFSENLKFFRNSENFPKIWKRSENWKSLVMSPHHSDHCLKGHKSLRVLFGSGFQNGQSVSQSASQSVSDKGTYRAVWGQLKNRKFLVFMEYVCMSGQN